jgi:hypothetical protein
MLTSTGLFDSVSALHSSMNLQLQFVAVTEVTSVTLTIVECKLKMPENGGKTLFFIIRRLFFASLRYNIP